MKKFISIFATVALFASVIVPLSNALAYGGGGGGSVVSSCQPSFYDITPAKDANLSSLSTVEFSVGGSQLSSESDFLSLMIGDQLISPLSVTEKANGDLRVTANVSSYITNGANKITLFAKTQKSDSCKRTFAFFVTVGADGGTGDGGTGDGGTGDGGTGDGGTGTGAGFNDTRGHWASYYIEQLKALGVISGDSDTGDFRPDDPINRAEILKMILLALNISVPSSILNSPFSDVPTSAWFAVYVAKAKELGLIGGYADGTFKPGNYITRAEMLKVILMATGLNLASNTTNVFSDVSSDAWYYNYVAYAYNNSIVIGYDDGTFRPNAPVTRAEAVKIISRIMEHLGWL